MYIIFAFQFTFVIKVPFSTKILIENFKKISGPEHDFSNLRKGRMYWKLVPEKVKILYKEHLKITLKTERTNNKFLEKSEIITEITKFPTKLDNWKLVRLLDDILAKYRKIKKIFFKYLHFSEKVSKIGLQCSKMRLIISKCSNAISIGFNVELNWHGINQILA